MVYLRWGLVAVAGVLISATGAKAQRPIPVHVTSQPPGAMVYFNTLEEPIGRTPLRNVRIPRGSQTLIFRLENYQEVRLPVQIRRRRETFHATLKSLATVVVSAGNQAAQGAQVKIDGEPLGVIPLQQIVEPGRHLIQVERQGYATFSQWTELTGGQVLTLPVLLEAEAPETGSILVAGDISGAAIYIDGEPKGVTPMLIENVTAGTHRVEIRPNDAPPHQSDVRVIAGERSVLNPALRPKAPTGGSLRIVTTPAGAIVRVDGETLGEAPVTKEGLAPGEHILEASYEGHEPVQQPVTIEEGRQRVVAVTLKQQPGRIVVNASADDAQVTVDGQERGAAPVIVDDAARGTHAVVVKAPGFQDYRETCEVGPGRDCVVDAEMEPVGTLVRARANIGGAELYVDGELKGPLPWEGTVPVGSHRIEIRAAGYRPHVEQANLTAGSTREFNVALVGVNELTMEERQRQLAERERRMALAVSHGASPLPVNQAILDTSIGWPHLAEVRLNVGILPWLEGGFGARTFGRLTEFEGRVKVGQHLTPQVAVGGQARVGGGIGPSRDPTDDEKAAAMASGDPAPDTHPVNTLFMSLEGLGSLHFSRAGAFTLWVAWDLYTDRYDFSADDSDVFVTRDRQNQGRLRLGGVLELVLTRHWNAWGLLEGIVVGPDNDRRVYGDVLGVDGDTELYFRLGLSRKF